MAGLGSGGGNTLSIRRSDDVWEVPVEMMGEDTRGMASSPPGKLSSAHLLPLSGSVMKGVEGEGVGAGTC